MRRSVLSALCFPWLLVAAPNIDTVLAKLPPPEASYLSAEQLADPGFHAKDGKGSCGIVPATADAAPTYRVVVGEKPEKHWETGFNWTTAKGTGPKLGDAVLLTFEARCIDDGDEAKGQVHPVLRRSVKPYNFLFSETCTFGKAWKRFSLAGAPPADMVEDGILIGLNFGLQAQRIEIRDIRVLNFGKKVSAMQLAKAVGSTGQSAANQVVGEELEPGLLWKMGAFADFVATPDDFRPGGAWQAAYGIYTCHGYMGKANKYTGLLLLERTPRADGTFDLKATQTVQLDAGVRQVTEAAIHCQSDALATPLAWTVRSHFVGPDRKPIEDLDTEETGPGQKPTTEPVTGDWCLFEAVQRLAPEAAIPEFTLLEGMSVRKESQRLSYRGQETYQIAGEERTFRRYVQIGHGILPTNYWLNERGQLLAAVTHSRAYLLVPKATEQFEAYSAAQMKRYGKKNVPRRPQETK